MTKIFLVRHGLNDMVGKAIAGRNPGVHLNATGIAQAKRLVARLAGESIQKIFSSPLERCRETAAPIASRLGLEPIILPEVIEIDYGDWTGKSVAELRENPLWNQWNERRTLSRVPDGETMLEIQNRMIAQIEKIRRDCNGETVAIFSHGDPIKTVICFFLGIPLDFFQRIEISPASVSLMCIGHDFVKFEYVNDQRATGDQITY
jgi:probable phosphoglycerate mutase